MPDIAIGKIVSPHGVTGSVKVWPYSDFRERCSQLPKINVYVGNPGQSVPEQMAVSGAFVYGGFWLIKFAEIKSREEAARLKGGLIYIAAKDRFPLPAGCFYHNQIVGLEVYDVSGKHLGRVVEIHPTGAHDLYLVAGEKGEMFLPAVKEFIKEINIERGTMLARPPEGLDEL